MCPFPAEGVRHNGVTPSVLLEVRILPPSILRHAPTNTLSAEEVLPNGVTQVFCGEQEADTFMQEARHKFMDKGYKRVNKNDSWFMVRVTIE